MENVKNFSTHDNGRTLEVVKSTMNELGYSFNAKVLNAADYGVPQKRERTYMVCFRNDIDSSKFNFPDAIPLKRYVRDVLSQESECERLFTDRTDIILDNDKMNASSVTSPIRIGKVGKGGQGERIYSIDGLATTLTAYGGGQFAKTNGYLIDGKVRRLIPRECARLMGFPDNYVINPSVTAAYRQFGNSVVVDVLQYIAKNITKVNLK